MLYLPRYKKESKYTVKIECGCGFEREITNLPIDRISQIFISHLKSCGSMEYNGVLSIAPEEEVPAGFLPALLNLKGAPHSIEYQDEKIDITKV